MTCIHCQLETTQDSGGTLSRGGGTLYREGFETALDLHFTPAQSRLFAHLYAAKGAVVEKQILFNALYSPRTQIRTIDVQIYKMRRKLRGTPWHIITRWGAGLQLIKEEKPQPQHAPIQTNEVRL